MPSDIIVIFKIFVKEFCMSFQTQILMSSQCNETTDKLMEEIFLLKPATNGESFIVAKCTEKDVETVRVFSMYKGKPIIEIAPFAFADCLRLKEVVIECGVISIGAYAFAKCYLLTNIIIPNSIKSIGNDAFSYCGLKNITIPNELDTIEHGVFRECHDLKEIKIPSSVTNIKAFAFQGCFSLVEVVIPNKVKNIGQMAFEGCWALQKIEIPNSVLSIDKEAFKKCHNLINITIPESVVCIGEGILSGCTGLREIELPFIGEKRVAHKNTDFRHIFSSIYDILSFDKDNIPKNLRKITITGGELATGAFDYCVDLEEIIISKNVTHLDKNAFSGCRHLTIYCETQFQPSDWADDWNPDNRPVVWGYKLEK